MSSSAERTHGNRLPLAIARRIDAVCERFEEAWQAGIAPRIEDYLADFQGSGREALLVELLRVEVDYRRQANERPCADDYRDRFPTLGPRQLALVLVAPSDTFLADSGPVSEQLPSIDGYEVMEELARGGMGVVYKARQFRLNRVVALKMLSAQGTVSPRALSRFRREAEAAAALHHPGIVPIYEVGEQNGRPYIAMAYVAGGSLDRRLGGKPMPADDSARLLMQLARAVQHAHEGGVVHRDLKPANVLLGGERRGVSPPVEGMPQERDTDGRALHRRADAAPLADHAAKIADFGLAKRLSNDEAGLTGSADLLGTPSYMAPEQAGASGAAVGPWTDIYGLGAILYEMLTGRPPFRAASAMETLIEVREKEPPAPHRLVPGVPRDLETICLKCLSKDPRSRYASAAALADDLARYLDGKPVRARPATTLDRVIKWSRRHPAVASLLAALALAIFAGYGATMWMWHKADLERREALRANEQRGAALDRFRISLAHREWLADNAARAEELLDACSAEQKQQWEWRYLHRLTRSRLGELIGHTGAIRAVVYRPDGKQLATSATDKTIRLWDLTATPPTSVTISGHQGTITAIAYRPDGQQLASADSSGVIRLWNVDGTAVGSLGEPRKEAITGLVYRPGGLAVARAGGFVDLVDDKGVSIRQPWRAHRNQVRHMAVSPDGRLLATSSTDATVSVWDAATGAAAHSLPPHSLDAIAVAFSPDGRWLASCSWDTTVRLYELATGRLRSMSAGHMSPVAFLAFSPDGGRIVSAGRDGAMKVCDTRTGRLLFTLHGHSGDVAAIAFSPDGERIASGGEDRAVKLWDATGGQDAEVLPPWSTSLPASLAFSPDGRRLATGHVFGNITLWDLATHAELARLTHPGGRVVSAAFRGDGQELATLNERGVLKRWDMRTKRELPPRDKLPAWVVAAAYDGEQLLLVSRDGGRLALHRAEKVRPLADVEGGPILVAFSADCRRLGVAAGERVSVYDVQSGDKLDDRESAGVVALALNEDGSAIAIGRPGGILVRRWAEATEVQCGNHAGAIHALAFSPDGRRLASSGFDLAVSLWDTRTGEDMLTLRGNLHNRSPLAFSPDGNRLVAVGLDLRPRLWNAAEPASVPPESTRERLLVWRDSEARAYVRNRQWAAARFHLDRLIAARPESAQVPLLLRRGEALAELRMWDEANKDFDRLAQLQPEAHLVRRSRGLARLGHGDRAGYLRDCGDLLVKLDTFPIADQAGLLYMALPVAEAVKDHEALLATGERIKARLPRLYAAIQCRAGKADQGLRMVSGPDARAWDLFFASLAEHRQGRMAEARAFQKRALEWIEQTDRVDPEERLQRAGWVHWMERVEVMALKADVEAILDAK